jgi:ribosome production factor 2
MSDQEDTTPRTAKTHKGKLVLESREPKILEGPKQTLFIRGPKTSESVR